MGDTTRSSLLVGPPGPRPIQAPAKPAYCRRGGARGRGGGGGGRRLCRTASSQYDQAAWMHRWGPEEGPCTRRCSLTRFFARRRPLLPHHHTTNPTRAQLENAQLEAPMTPERADGTGTQRAGRRVLRFSLDGRSAEMAPSRFSLSPLGEHSQALLTVRRRPLPAMDPLPPV